MLSATVLSKSPGRDVIVREVTLLDGTAVATHLTFIAILKILMLKFEFREPGFCLELPGFGNLRITRVFRVRVQPGYHTYFEMIKKITTIKIQTKDKTKVW